MFRGVIIYALNVVTKQNSVLLCEDCIIARAILATSSSFMKLKLL